MAGLSMAGIVTYYVWLKFLPNYAQASVGHDLATAQRGLPGRLATWQAPEATAATT